MTILVELASRPKEQAVSALDTVLLQTIDGQHCYSRLSPDELYQSGWGRSVSQPDGTTNLVLVASDKFTPTSLAAIKKQRQENPAVFISKVVFSPGLQPENGQPETKIQEVEYKPEMFLPRKEAIGKIAKIFGAAAVGFTLVSCFGKDPGSFLESKTNEQKNAELANFLKQMIGIEDEMTLDQLKSIFVEKSFRSDWVRGIEKDSNQPETIVLGTVYTKTEQRKIHLITSGRNAGEPVDKPRTTKEAVYPRYPGIDIQQVKAGTDNMVIVHTAPAQKPFFEQIKDQLDILAKHYGQIIQKTTHLHLVNFRLNTPLVLDGIANNGPTMDPFVMGHTGNVKENGRILRTIVGLNLYEIHNSALYYGLLKENVLIEVLVNEAVNSWAADARPNQKQLEYASTVAGFIAVLDPKFAQRILGQEIIQTCGAIAKIMNKMSTRNI